MVQLHHSAPFSWQCNAWSLSFLFLPFQPARRTGMGLDASRRAPARAERSVMQLTAPACVAWGGPGCFVNLVNALEVLSQTLLNAHLAVVKTIKFARAASGLWFVSMYKLCTPPCTASWHPTECVRGGGAARGHLVCQMGGYKNLIDSRGQKVCLEPSAH